ncbi:hypothetical protein [Legionella sp. CNM-4043-24]|uniref:hypothetical protein n=1 Tax=Legionella sp. CNM-4043-24 TaxID=3421646 RepID=UPI00403B31DE
MSYYKTLSAALLALGCSSSLHADGINLECPIDKPVVLKTLENRKINLYDMAHFPTAGTFGGPQLEFSVSANPHQKKNELAISSRMGELVISAAEKDTFDVIVTAKNGCGQASTKFNVIIVEEE